jgi:hypothetical protein
MFRLLRNSNDLEFFGRNNESMSVLSNCEFKTLVVWSQKCGFSVSMNVLFLFYHFSSVQ